MREGSITTKIERFLGIERQVLYSHSNSLKRIERIILTKINKRGKVKTHIKYNVIKIREFDTDPTTFITKNLEYAIDFYNSLK